MLVQCSVISSSDLMLKYDSLQVYLMLKVKGRSPLDDFHYNCLKNFLGHMHSTNKNRIQNHHTLDEKLKGDSPKSLFSSI